MSVQRVLVIAGLLLVVVGLAWPLLSRIGVGRLPGDFLIERGNFRFYFPFMSLLIVNVLVWMLMRLFGGR